MDSRDFIGMKAHAPHRAPHGERKPVPHPLKTYGSTDLFEGSTEVGIEHAGSLYRLKITRQGKLILNK